MANPGLVRAGLKIAKAVAKKRKQAAIKNKKIGSFEKERLEIQASKIGKTRANSTNNVNTGPIDRAIKRTRKIRDKHQSGIDYIESYEGMYPYKHTAPSRMYKSADKANFNLYKLKEMKNMKIGKFPKKLLKK
jgi:hypothetical protein